MGLWGTERELWWKALRVNRAEQGTKGIGQEGIKYYIGIINYDLGGIKE